MSNLESFSWIFWRPKHILQKTPTTDLSDSWAHFTSTLMPQGIPCCWALLSYSWSSTRGSRNEIAVPAAGKHSQVQRRRAEGRPVLWVSPIGCLNIHVHFQVKVIFDVWFAMYMYTWIINVYIESIFTDYLRGTFCETFHNWKTTLFWIRKTSEESW